MPRNPEFARRVQTVLEGDFGRAPAKTATPPVRLHIGDSDRAPGPEMPLAGALGVADRREPVGPLDHPGQQRRHVRLPR